jgi:hypothetical protein
MGTYSQLPGLLNLSLRRGDSFGTTVDFDVSVASHTVAAYLTSPISGVTTGSMTASIANATAGVVSLSMTDTQTSALRVGTHGWRLEWTAPGGIKRTVLSGHVEVTR